MSRSIMASPYLNEYKFEVLIRWKETELCPRASQPKEEWVQAGEPQTSSDPIIQHTFHICFPELYNVHCILTEKKEML